MEGLIATIHRIEKNINYAKNRIYKGGNAGTKVG